jgi:hypothetical protein
MRQGDSNPAIGVGSVARERAGSAEKGKVEILATLALSRPTLGGDKADYAGTAHTKRRRCTFQGDSNPAIGVVL